MLLLCKELLCKTCHCRIECVLIISGFCFVKYLFGNVDVNCVGYTQSKRNVRICFVRYKLSTMDKLTDEQRESLKRLAPNVCELNYCKVERRKKRYSH